MQDHFSIFTLHKIDTEYMPIYVYEKFFFPT